MKNFWQEQLKKHGKLALLAPMDGYWDSAYRQSMKRVSPHIYCISEFYSADWLVHSKFLADAVLPHKWIEKPLIVQIFGKDPEMFARAAKIISDPKYGVAWIDINMWCPAKKVVRSWHWSSLLINEDTAFEIVRTINEATHLPISVKTRLSFDGNQDLIKFAKGLEKAWASMLTIHGRTAAQAYTWNADFTNIYDLKNHVTIPVICNWDIKNYDDGMKKVKDLDGIMLGRASFGNPWCFLWEKHMSDDKFLEENNLDKNNFVDWEYHPTLEEILIAMEFHATQLVLTKWERKWNLEIRKHLVQYLSHFPGVKVYRKRLVTTESIEITREIIKDIKERFQKDLQKRPSLDEINKEDYDI